MILKHPGTSEWLGADWVQVSGVPTKLHSNKLTGDAAAARPGPRFQRRCSGEAAGAVQGRGEGDVPVHPGLHSCSDLFTLAVPGLQKPPELDLLPTHKNSVVA